MIQAEFRCGPGFHQERPIVDVSEDGIFALVRPCLAPGTRATVRFRHPRVARIVTTGAVVARRVMPGCAEGPPGIGFLLLEGLEALAADRRACERRAVDLPARLAVGGVTLPCRMVDLSRLGAALELDLGLKRADGRPMRAAGQGDARRVVEVVHLLRSGSEAFLTFQEPTTFQHLRVAGRIARTPAASASAALHRMGLHFEVDLDLLTRPAPVAPCRPHPVSITGAVDLDRAATVELEMRSLLRRVDWSTGEGHFGSGRLVLAGRDRVLVSCTGEVPPQGADVTVVLQTPEDSSAPPVGMTALVLRAGPRLVAGGEAGFVGRVTGFFSGSDEHRYQGLVSWLAGKGAA